ncbi:MAG TPA: glycosyltransferase 87 family protein, partial [Streptosporangiaceae bacterium]|nr:glycosyltransferase 87 family protein [Streptosporangiaceae bacterium]
MATSNRIDNWLLFAGVVALGAVLAWYAHLTGTSPGMWSLPLDLGVYRDAGLIVRHVAPFYDPSRGSPLYDWPGPPGFAGIKFIYPPFAALPFAVIPAHLKLLKIEQVASAVNLLAVVLAASVTVRALGRERGLTGKRGLALVLLGTALALMTEPVQRTIYLGQVELVLMALVLWDVLQPDRRWWKGIGVGIAAGVKLVPLIFIPYLLLTRRYRAAAVAAGTFAVTIVLGFVVTPTDSSRWWLHGLFLKGSYAGNIPWEGNQSLLALIERLGGTGAHGIWLATAVIVAILGLGAAAILDRNGHRVLGVAACALTGVLISPISWDHHWVWVLMAAPVFLYYGLLARGWSRWACFAGGAITMAIYGAWATKLWGETDLSAGWDRGVIWAAPSGNNLEQTWHGWQLFAGNAYVLTGLALLVLLLGTALRVARTSNSWVVAPPGSRAPQSQPTVPRADLSGSRPDLRRTGIRRRGPRQYRFRFWFQACSAGRVRDSAVKADPRLQPVVGQLGEHVEEPGTVGNLPAHSRGTNAREPGRGSRYGRSEERG